MLPLLWRLQGYGEAGRGWPGPPNSPAAAAVAGVGIAAAGAVARAAAVGTEAPVARKAVVAVGPCHTGLAGAVTGAGVAEGAGAHGERS